MEKELKLAKLFAMTDCNKNIIEEVFREGINWGIFLEECLKNKIVNLVLYHLKEYQLLNYVPTYIYHNFTSYWNGSVVKANAYYKHIEIIANIMNKANLEYAFIKGFDLVDKLYYKKSPYIREFNDLDILVAEKDLTIVEKLFLNEGFVFGDYDFESNEIIPASRYDIIRMKIDSHQLYTLVKKESYNDIFAGPIFIDINYTIFEGGKKFTPIATEKILTTTEIRTSFNNIQYKSLDIYYTFIQLEYHLYREAHTELFRKQGTETSLQKFCDIYEYLNWANDKWNVETLKNIIHEANLSESLWFVLFFTDMIYETVFCKDILGENIEYVKKYGEIINNFKEKYQIGKKMEN